MDAYSILEFVGITGVMFGLGAFLMGQAIAETWRPAWQNVPYGFVLAGFNHFMDCALFGGDWLSFTHYFLDAVVIIAVALFAHRLVLARKMETQYPWLYERSGLLTWRDKRPTATGS